MNSEALLPALLSTFSISLLPNLLLFLLPNPEDIEGSTFLSVGKALAAGGLLGDVFLHTMVDSHSHSHSDSDAIEESDHLMEPGIWLLAGFTLFLFFDIAIKSFGGHHDNHYADQHDDPGGAERQDRNLGQNSPDPNSTSVFNSSVFLNLTVDALHNFTDGLAIGASYASPNATASGGFFATVSIMLHEIPHELGDYCVLIQNGFTKKQAIQTQFFTAAAAALGAVAGIYTAHWEGITYLTAGGFLYLACVNILPEVLSNTSDKQHYTLLAFVTGIALLYIVARLESYDDHHHHTKSLSDEAFHHHNGHHDHTHQHSRHRHSMYEQPDL